MRMRKEIHRTFISRYCPLRRLWVLMFIKDVIELAISDPKAASPKGMI